MLKNRKNDNNNTEEEQPKKEWTKTIKNETIIRRSIKRENEGGTEA